jgi:hypothetical protein
MRGLSRKIDRKSNELQVAEICYAHRNFLLLSDNKDHKKISYGAAQEDNLHFVSQLHGKNLLSMYYPVYLKV